MKTDAPRPSAPSWGEALLVCKQCRKRSNGPKGFKNRQAVQVVKQALRAVEPRPRVLLTTCLGLCPKGALAIARVGAGDAPRIAAAASLAQVEALWPVLSR